MSTIRVTNIKHESSASNNIVLDSSGGVDMDAFTVSGSAPADSVNLDASGRLLVGTSTAPSGTLSQYSKLAVIGNTSAATGSYITFGHGGSASSFTSGTDIASIYFTDNGAGEFASIRCYSDANSGSGDYPGRLVFSTTADSASSPTERMRITNTGRLNIARTSDGTSAAYVNIQVSSSFAGICFDADSTSARTHIRFNNGNGNVGYIETNGSSTTYSTSSDYRLKENVVPLTGAIDRVNQLQVHRFNFIADPDKTVDGFIAHEAQAVVPECVSGEKDAVNEDGSIKPQGIDQSKLVPLLTAALQEALAEIAFLKDRVAALEGA